MKVPQQTAPEIFTVRQLVDALHSASKAAWTARDARSAKVAVVGG